MRLGGGVRIHPFAPEEFIEAVCVWLSILSVNHTDNFFSAGGPMRLMAC